MDNFVKTDSLFALPAPSLNSTGESDITTGTTSSDAGRGIAQVRITTEGGTNDFHGEVFYLIRNDWLEANSFFNNLAGTPRPREKQHYFGFAGGGPVYAPKFGEGGPRLWDGHDKAFRFFSYEGFRETFAAIHQPRAAQHPDRRGRAVRQLHAQAGASGLAAADATDFGRVTATGGDPRIVHFTFKATW